MVKRLLLIVMLVIGGFSAVTAQVKTLVVQKIDGTTLSIPLSECPKLTYEGTKVVLKTSSQTYEFSTTERFDIYFDKSATALNGLVSKKNFSLDGSTVVLSNLYAGSKVGVYTTGGRLCQQGTADAKGHLVLDLSSLSKGVYVIKAGNESFKIIRP